MLLCYTGERPRDKATDRFGARGEIGLLPAPLVQASDELAISANL